MDVALAFDISTSIIGWAVVHSTPLVKQAAYQKPIMWGHIDLTKIDTGYWGKVDYAEAAIKSVIDEIKKQHNVTKLFIEDPVKKFRTGHSSAYTIALLARFNAVISLSARRVLSLDPLYIDATAARKAIGIPLLSKKKSGGKDQKQQTFEHLKQTTFVNESWPLKKSGMIQNWCYDRVDAFVIALAGCIGLGDAA